MVAITVLGLCSGMAPRVCNFGGGEGGGCKSKFDQLESVNVEV